MSHGISESLDDSTFEAVLGSSTWFVRTTLRDQELTYVLRVIQQPDRAQALRSKILSADRRILDPPPVVNLLIYERRDGRQFDITFSYDETFFLFVTLQSGPSHKGSAISAMGKRHAILSGCPVSSGAYLDHPTKAIYFIFPSLSVHNEGSYELSFNLYETNNNPENGDAPAIKLDRESLEQDHSRDVAPSCEGFIWRIAVNSAIFRVYKRNFPGRLESTRLCRVLAEQGVRLRIKRVVGVGNRDVKQEKDTKEERVLGPSLVEQPDSSGLKLAEDEFAPWNKSGHSSRKDLTSSIGSSEDRSLSLNSNKSLLNPLSTPSCNVNLHHTKEIETPTSMIQELSNNQIAEPFHDHNTKKPIVISNLPVRQSSFNSRYPISQQHNEISKTGDGKPLEKTRNLGKNTVISKEEIWFNFVNVLPPILRLGTMNYKDSNFEAVIPANGKPLSHAIKRASYTWWLANRSRPWEDILPQEILTTTSGHLGHTIFFSWYTDFTEDIHGLNYIHNDWHGLNGPLLSHDTEVTLVEQMVNDIYRRLQTGAINPVRELPSGTLFSIQSSDSFTLNTSSAISRAANSTTKRCYEDALGPDKRSDDDDDDEPYRDKNAKRKKNNTEKYSQHLICTEFAAGQSPACPKCFFGAWPSVDHLKRDHLVKIHNFDSAALRVGNEGTEPERWWRLFDKLHLGFRKANPNTFIPGPLWEDRIAHNAYNRILSDAMKEAERIRQRGTQALASQFQDLLERQRSTERQELHQIVLNLMSSNSRNITVIGPLTPESQVERQLQSSLNNTHNGDIMVIPPPQQSDPASIHLPRLGLFPASISRNTQHLQLSPNGSLLDDSLPILNHPSLSLYSIEARSSTVTNRTLANSVSTPLVVLRDQTSAPITTMSTAAQSQTVNGNDHFANPTSGHSNLVDQEPFRKLCRCRFHSLECIKFSTEDGNEWCISCSGWFPGSMMAEPFFLH